MKQIFDWLREQVLEEAIVDGELRSTEVVFLPLQDFVDLVDEAEAKWEKDCCEWKPTHLHNHARFSNCMVKFDELHRQDVECFNFCPYCGKRIKISEVE